MTLKSLARRPVQAFLGRFGYTMERVDAEHFPPDFTPAEIDLYTSVKPYTLTSPERIIALRDAVRYISRTGVVGAIVECGVWRGGSMLTIAKTLVEERDTGRDLYLYDTFTQMPPPTDEDVDLHGMPIADIYEEALAFEGYANLPLDRVRALMESTGYPSERLHFVPGMVEETIPDSAPDEIALCRLDTDFYLSTKHEMEHLAPRITEAGILIVDDYGHFMGSKKAVDEYFAARNLTPLLQRIDWTGRLVVVTERIPAAARDAAVSTAPPS